MPEVSSAPATTATPPVTTGTGPATPAAEPKVTYGTPAEVSQPAEPTTGAEDGLETEPEGFGDEDFGDELEVTPPTPAEEFNSETYQQLKQALAANPELFKKVKKAISEVTRFKGMVESPEVLRQTFDRIETLGGLDSVESEAQEWNRVYEMFASGDPGVIDFWAKDNPEGFAKLIPEAIDRFQQLDPAGWNWKMAQVFMATVQQSGMASALETLASMDAVAKSPDAKNLINKIINTVNAVNSHAEKSPTRDLTPEARKLGEKEKNLADRESNLYRQQVGAAAAPVQKRIISTALNSVLKGRKLDSDGKNKLVSDIRAEYDIAVSKDKDYTAKIVKLFKSGDTESLIKLSTAHMERNMPLAARRAWRMYSGISGFSEKEAAQVRQDGQSRREAGGGGAAVQMTKTPAPKAQDVDWQRMRNELGRDRADSAFSFGLKDLYGGKRFYYRKNDAKGIYTF